MHNATAAEHWALRAACAYTPWHASVGGCVCVLAVLANAVSMRVLLRPAMRRGCVHATLLLIAGVDCALAAATLAHLSMANTSDCDARTFTFWRAHWLLFYASFR